MRTVRGAPPRTLQHTWYMSINQSTNLLVEINALVRHHTQPPLPLSGRGLSLRWRREYLRAQTHTRSITMANAEEEEDNCAICLSPMYSDGVFRGETLKCGHVFHARSAHVIARHVPRICMQVALYSLSLSLIHPPDLLALPLTAPNARGTSCIVGQEDIKQAERRG